jgi:hypothetical protein
MKVRLLTVAAIAAVAMGTQATAQQGDLERALADLNSGVVAPSMGGASASGSTGLDVSGDARMQSLDTADAGGVMNTRFRVNMGFAVNEATSVFVQWTGAENHARGGTAASDANGISQAYINTSNLLGTGGAWQMGRSYATVGSGRILGSDDWDQNPSTWDGYSYSNNFGGVDLGFGHMSEDTSTNGGYWAVSASFDLGNDSINGIDFDSITQEAGDNAWWEASTGGTVSMFNWSATMADYDDGAAGAGASAYSIGLSMSDWTGGFVGNLSYSMTDSDGGFAVIDGAAHGQTGISDVNGQSWVGTGDRETTALSLDLNIMEGWDTSLSMHDVEDDAGEADEMDLTIGRDLGNGVGAWIGYGDGTDAAGADFTVYYVQLSLAF